MGPDDDLVLLFADTLIEWAEIDARIAASR